MKKHYVTFGQIHVHSVAGRTLDKDSVAVFLVENAQQGRKRAFELFGDKFFTDYHGEEWNSELLEFFPRGYIELP